MIWLLSLFHLIRFKALKPTIFSLQNCHICIFVYSNKEVMKYRPCSHFLRKNLKSEEIVHFFWGGWGGSRMEEILQVIMVRMISYWYLAFLRVSQTYFHLRQCTFNVFYSDMSWLQRAIRSVFQSLWNHMQTMFLTVFFFPTSFCSWLLWYHSFFENVDVLHVIKTTIYKHI